MHLASFSPGALASRREPAWVRLAPISSAFDRALSTGALTQLELLDLCAGALHADGIVLDVAHFPRLDDEYLAQLKKFAADLALTLVAVRDDALTAEPATEAFRIAATLGAPYVLTRLPAAGIDPVSVYNEALTVISEAVSEAKARNVTLAVRNVDGSLAGDAFGLGRLRKEADSAWLRFALDPVSLTGEPDDKVRKHVVLGYRSLGRVPANGRDPAASTVLAALSAFPGFLCLDYDGDENAPEAMGRLVRGWKAALAEESVTEPHVPS